MPALRILLAFAIASELWSDGLVPIHPLWNSNTGIAPTLRLDGDPVGFVWLPWYAKAIRGSTRNDVTEYRSREDFRANDGGCSRRNPGVITESEGIGTSGRRPAL